MRTWKLTCPLWPGCSVSWNSQRSSVETASLGWVVKVASRSVLALEGVCLGCECGLASRLGAAVDVFEATRHVIGQDDIGNGLAAFVAVADEEGDGVADETAALVGPFDDLERLGARLLGLRRPGTGLNVRGADERGHDVEAVDSAGDGGALGDKGAGRSLLAHEAARMLVLMMFQGRHPDLDQLAAGDGTIALGPEIGELAGRRGFTAHHHKTRHAQADAVGNADVLLAQMIGVAGHGIGRI